MPANHPYHGPSVAEMIANHSLAENIIKHHHPDGNEILDNDEMRRLRRFVEKPDEKRSQILQELGIDEARDTNAGGYQGSLVGYVALKHGNGNVLTGDEMERLRVWFGENDVGL